MIFSSGGRGFGPRNERGRQLRRPLCLIILFVCRLSRVSLRSGRTDRSSRAWWSSGSSWPSHSGRAIFSGRAGWSRWSGGPFKTSCKRNGGDKQNSQCRYSHFHPPQCWRRSVSLADLTKQAGKKAERRGPDAALLVVLAQYLTGLSIDEMQPGAGGELEPFKEGETRPVVESRTHAGVVKVRRFSFQF